MNNLFIFGGPTWKVRICHGERGRNYGSARRCWRPLLDLFSQKGYHNVSMAEIAEKAEFAIGTLYKFFQNKEDLYKTIVLERCDDFEDAFRLAMEQSDDEVEKLRHYVRFRGERFRNNLPFVRLYLAESRGISFNLKVGVDNEIRANDITTSSRDWPRSLPRGWLINGLKKSPTLIIWRWLSTAPSMHRCYSGLTTPSAIHTRKTRTPFWIFSSKDYYRAVRPQRGARAE